MWNSRSSQLHVEIGSLGVATDNGQLATDKPRLASVPE